jgi:hypothetical protein
MRPVYTTVIHRALLLPEGFGGGGVAENVCEVDGRICTSGGGATIVDLSMATCAAGGATTTSYPAGLISGKV